MELIYSNINKNHLLHLVFRKNDFKKISAGDRNNVVDVKNFIQMSALRLYKGQTFEPHKHVWKKGEKKVIAQESWVVVRGKVKCKLYDIDSKLIAEPILNAGDCSITLEGGHTYEILEQETFVYEYKTGPYKGQKNDKIFLNEI